MSEVFDGTVEVQTAPEGQTTVLLDGTAGQALLGGNGQDGELILADAGGGPGSWWTAQRGTSGS